MNRQATADIITSAGERERPLLRGVLHLFAAIAAIIGTPMLMLIAASPQAYIGGAIFSASLILLYLTSASYHMITWPQDVRRVLRRLDHSMIFVLIAGTYTPFCLVAVDLAWGISMLSVIWGIAGLGIIMRLVWPQSPTWLGVAFYVGLGWLAAVASRELIDAFSLGPLLLLTFGGVLYTIGGVIYGLRKPNPFPRVFGYHEVFHLFVIAGSALHYILVTVYVLPS